MRKLFKILIAISLVSCTKDFVPIGNFSSCSEPGLVYEELYFKGDSIKYSNQEGVVSNWEKYEIKQDTFFYTTPGEMRIPTYGLISNYSKNNFSLYYPQSNRTFKFYRIEDSNIDTENNESLKKENKRRFLKSECYMTESEIEKLPQF